MSANTVYCHILEKKISVVADLNGNVTNVICPEFNRLTHTCFMKSKDSSFMNNLLNKLSDQMIGSRYNYCEFMGHHGSPISKLVGTK